MSKASPGFCHNKIRALEEGDRLKPVVRGACYTHARVFVGLLPLPHRPTVRLTTDSLFIAKEQCAVYLFPMIRFAFAFVFFMSSLTIISAQSQSPKSLAETWNREKISRISPSNVRHKDLKLYLDELKGLGLRIEEVGRSYADREIYQIEWGTGPKRIFMWSQMHGDEPTATSALVDMFAFLQRNKELPWVKKLSESMTIRGVPMLNPDGTEFFQRRNLQGIDINRDAVGLKTPEGRLLKKLRDEWNPEIGFNLHNQGQLTTAGDVPRQAAISLLAVLGDPKGVSTPGFERNKRLISAMTLAVNEFIPGYVGRYDDTYNDLAFGDKFSAWGTPVILVEAGGLHGQDEFYLVKLNFVMYLTALEVIADGSHSKYDPEIYLSLPVNASGRLMNFIFRNANLVGTNSSSVADIGINFERRRAEFTAPTIIREVGLLSKRDGLVEFDASDFNVVHRFGRIRPGDSGELLFYKKNRRIDWSQPNLEYTEAPDAIFSLGGWFVGEELMKTKDITPKR